jgi:hypothetical protein
MSALEGELSVRSFSRSDFYLRPRRQYAVHSQPNHHQQRQTHVYSLPTWRRYGAGAAPRLLSMRSLYQSIKLTTPNSYVFEYGPG